MIVIGEDILEEAIETFGEDNQVTVAIEEMSELIKELCKTKRQGERFYNEYKHLCEEIADVIIMLHQLRMIFNCDDEVAKYVEIKLSRLAERISAAKDRSATK